MPVNNMFSTWFNSWFGTWFWIGTGWWNNNWFQNPAQTKTTKQQKFPWLNQQQIANIEKYTANLTWAEKKQEQQKIYQAMIQAIEAEKFNDSRTAMENERYRNSLSKTDPRECKFDQSACRQSALVDLVKDARNLKANTDENTVMQMFMQEMDYRGIGMDKLNAYLDSGDESILYETWLKTQRWGTKDLINQAWDTTDKSWGSMSKWEKVEDVTNKTNLVWLWAEKIDEAANKFADKFTVTWEKAANNLANKIQNMSKEEVAQYRKQYEKLLKDKDWRVGRVQGDTIVEQLWNGIKWNISYDYNDKDFMEWLVSQKANLWESLIWADDILKWETNPNVIQFFGNIPSSALKTFTATVRGMSNPYDTMKWLYKIALTKEWHQAILDRYGSWDAFARAMNTDPVWVADDILAVAELGTNLVRGGMNVAWKITWNQSLITNASKIPQIWSANDVLADRLLHGWDLTISKNFAQDWKNTDAWLVNGGFKEWYNPDLKTIKTKWLYWVMDSTLWNKGVLWAANKVLQTESDLGKMTEAAKDAYKAVVNSNFVDELINKMVGIDKEDRTFIKENKDLVNDYISWKKNTETIYDTVQEKLSDKALEKTEMGAEYDKLTQNTEKVVNTEWITNDKNLQKLLKKWKITIDADWNLQFDKLSEYNPTQQKAIQDAWETLKNIEDAKNVDAWTALDQRRKIDDKINWEWKATDKSKVDMDAEDLIKQMRRSVDARAKQYVPWLEELDTKYQPLIEEVRQMKKDRFNSDGTIKDNARSKIRNLTKAWNEARLERLEKIAPWITQDLKALDAALTVEKLTKNSVWQYYKWWGIALWIKSLFSGNIPAAIWFTAVGILATPKNFVKLIQREPAIASKLMNWDTLTSADISRLQAIASRLEDGMEMEE